MNFTYYYTLLWTYNEDRIRVAIAVNYKTFYYEQSLISEKYSRTEEELEYNYRFIRWLHTNGVRNFIF